jgi:transposase InsO family protein
MSKARLVLTALFVDRQTPAEVAARYGVHRSWVYKLKARYQTDGEAAFEPRSRRPHTSPTAIPPATVTLITELRDRLTTAGLDAGPDTIAWHLAHHHDLTVSPSTIGRTLTRAGLITPAPTKRPKSSYHRFAATLPNETWQADFTHYQRTQPDGTPGPDPEILTWLDDCSRFALSVTAHPRVTGPIVRASFRATFVRHGTPASTLTDNGMVFTTRLAGGKGGRNALETELHRLGVTQKNARPNHPTTCGKVERFQQTLKHWLAAQPDQPATITQLQALLDTFTDQYNHRRPHRSLPHRATPRPSTPACPRPAPPAAATPIPTTASGATASTTAAVSPCASLAACTTSASAEPTPEPTSSCSSTTSTSAWSTPPPANCSASSSSTPPRTTSPPVRPKAPPENDAARTHSRRFGLSPMT